jgi:NADH-quinone oxidoreductase subunit A
VGVEVVRSTNDMNLEYAAVLLIFLATGLLAVVMILATTYLGPKKPSKIKDEAFECGSPTSGPARSRFPVKFYVVAILFIIFDIEVAFLYPWAVLFRSLGMLGFIEMLFFVLILLFGLIYAWKRGALEWE